MTMERVVKNLAVQLTDEEVNERARRAAALAGEEDERAAALESAKERAKSIVKDAESALSGKRAERSQLARIARERVEYRDVECEERLSRAERRRVITRLDTYEIVQTHPASDDEMRKGAKWKPNYALARSELRHPDEPDVVLDLRALSDAERQVPLPNAEGETKATSLAEAAAISAAKEKGDLPSDEYVSPRPDPQTTVTSETLDKLTPVETKRTDTSARDALLALGIEWTPAPACVTVFSVATDDVAKVLANKPMSTVAWEPTADGARHQSSPCLRHDATDIRAAAQRIGVAVEETSVVGKWSSDRYELICERGPYEALDPSAHDELEDVLVGEKFLPLEGSDLMRWSHSLETVDLASVRELAKRIGLPVTTVRDVDLPCAACGTVMRSTLLGPGLLCFDSECVKAHGENGKAETPASVSKPAKKGKGAKSRTPESLDALVAKHSAEIDATKSSQALGSCWVDVTHLKGLPVETRDEIAAAWYRKAKRMGVSAGTLADMRKRGEAPADESLDGSAAQPSA